MNDIEQRAKISSANGFIAALDQSGGSTPKTLKLYKAMSDLGTSSHEGAAEKVAE